MTDDANRLMVRQIPHLRRYARALTGGPAAQFMYQDAKGGRLTLYVSSGRHGNRETAFRYVEEGPISAFYWIDGPFGYALVGEVEKDDLLRGARLVYEQLTP